MEKLEKKPTLNTYTENIPSPNLQTVFYSVPSKYTGIMKFSFVFTSTPDSFSFNDCGI